MKPILRKLASLACLVLCAPLCGIAHAQTVTTAAGAVTGTSEAGVTRFLGLRYAAPPIGALRWKAPTPLEHGRPLQTANVVGPSCIQPPTLSLESGGGDTRPLSEDCLFLNVWTSDATPDAKLPVIVWIHGGALVFGSGGVPIYDGAPLARRGAVVVGINYRLGPLGYFAHPSVVNANGDMNFGLLDQIAALRWVKKNIAGFGGDPDNVTIVGQSAGAESVLALFTSPLAKGLFKRGIAQSPYGIPSHSIAKARTVAAKVASAVSLNGVHLHGAEATAAELRAVPAEAFGAIEDKAATLAPSFIVGDRAFPRTILGSFQAGTEAPLPLIIGNASDDGSIALAFGMEPAAVVKKLGVAKVFVRSLYPRELDDAQLGRETVRDLVFTAFARHLTYLHSTRAPTWRYYFSYVAEGRQGKQPGVPHGAEIPFTLSTLDLCECLDAPITEQDRAVANRMSTRWVDFARVGSPAPLDADAWPRDDPQQARLLQIDTIDAVRVDFMKRRLDAFIGTLNVLGAFSPAR